MTEYTLPPLEMPSEERLMDLLEKETKLEALMAAGVDNWEGYYDALAQGFVDGDFDF